LEDIRGVIRNSKSKKDEQYKAKRKGQTIQWLKEKGQTIQWLKEKGRTIQG